MKNLTIEEKSIYDKGIISTGRRITGGVFGSTLGFGIGHGITGFYKDIGWIFTVGEAVTYVGIIHSFVNFVYGSNKYDALTVLSLSVYFGLRIWEIIDVWRRPIDHNDLFNEIVKKKSQIILVPFVAKNNTVGLSLGVTF